MGNTKNIILLWKKVFSSWKYLAIVFLFTFFFYIFNAFLNNVRNIWSSYRNEGFSKTAFLSFTLMSNFWQSILFSSVISLILIGFLTGILVALMVYNFNIIKNNDAQIGFVSGAGIFLGVFAPGCAACGIGLVGLLGLTASFASLPFQGKEISLLALLLISFSVIKFSYNIANSKECKINIQTIERRSKK